MSIKALTQTNDARSMSFPHLHMYFFFNTHSLLCLCFCWNWWRKECQSFNSVAKTITSADRHSRRSPWCRFQHQSQANTSAADCAQVLERNMTPSTVNWIKVKAVSAPERAAGRRIWVQMEKRQGDLVTASMEVWKKQMKLNYRHTAKGHYVICMFKKLVS